MGLFILLSVSACDQGQEQDPVIGDWESAERIGSERNELEIDDDLEGEAVIYAFFEGDPVFVEFDVEVDEDGGDYELDFECQGDCASLDFTLDCEFDGDELECDGDGVWSEYEFVWRRS